MHKKWVILMSDMYKKIYDLCQEKGISVGKMCNELGISRGNLTELKMERIKTLKAENLKKISGYFGVSVDYLLGTETEKAPTQESERVSDSDLMAAFFRGADPTLTEEEMDALWEDARSYMEYKLAQGAKRGKNGQST